MGTPAGKAPQVVAPQRGAGQAMEPIFVDDRLDPGQFGDLMDQGLGVVAGEGLATAATGGRACSRMVVADLLGRDQGALGLAMSGLAAAFLPGGRGGRLALHPDRIGRRGLGGVGGVELEPALEIAEPVLKAGEPLLVALDQREDRRLDFRRGRLP